MLNPKVLHSLYRKMHVLPLVLLGLCMVLNLPQAQAQALGGGSFDHTATAFPLTGSHELVRCETCHIKGVFKSTPKACASCHVVGNQRDAVAPSAKHIAMSNPPIMTPLACDSCHNTSTFSATQFNHSMVQTGFCQVCHDGVRAKGLSAGHVETGGLSCDQCHTSSAFLPVPMFPHAVLNGDLTTCATCHDGRIAKGMPANHLPRSNSAQCGSCHINSTLNGFTSFAGGQMDHAGLTTACADCHGPSITGASFAGVSSIVVMPPTSPAGLSSHIPSSTNCESCHLGSLPVGLMAGNAVRVSPGSAFATPAPSTAQIHAGVTGGCSNCHDSNAVWMGVSAYPISPTSVVDKANYTGFQTRPLEAASTYSVADPAHPAGECSQCHAGTNYFSAVAVKPTNHIPYASTALCTACHTTTDYTLMPTLANIHANLQSTTTNCAQCHAANVVDGFKTTHLTIVGSPTNHMPITTACETCHFVAGSSVTPGTPMAQGTKFSGSLMSHTGITTGCVNCHVPSGTTVSFAGISKIVGMPATTPVGVNSHIPSSTTCETCHLSATPAGLVAANASKTAPGTAFLTAAVPLGPQIHTGITGSCSSCHDTNMVWMGMSVAAYAINPSKITTGAQYKGFQTRPTGAPSTAFGVTDAAHPAGECSSSGCHTGTTYFSGDLKPTNHIPYASTALCTACHTTTDYTLMPTLANIHANLQSTTTNCAQCHAANVVDGFKTTHLTIVGSPTNHMPITTACETCHFVAGSSVTPGTPMAQGTKFSGSLMSHTGITTGCVNCHVPSGTTVSFAGISKIVGMPATTPVGVNSHIPSSTTCETCHLSATPAGLVAANASKTAPGTAFLTAAVPLGPQIHTGITGSCSSCHDTNMVWMGMSVAAYAINPSKITTGAQYKGFQTRPTGAPSTAFGVTDAAHPAGECSSSGCHTGTTYFTGEVKSANHIPYASTALCTACHTTTDYTLMPTLANIHANLQSTTTNCAQCHAANVVDGFKTTHLTIVGSPTNHMPITTACETCHFVAGSSVTPGTPMAQGTKFSGSLMSHTGITTGCVNCHVPSGTTVSFAGISKIVGMPATTPVGVNSHIPSSTTCETCHLSATPAGLVAANASKTAPGTAFLTAAVPLGPQIHTGITGSCSSCHDTNMVWMGMSVAAYAINPSKITTGAQYKGFQTRPTGAPSTAFGVTDAAHPAGECSSSGCHTGTTYFSGDLKPTNHIPYASTALCTACHTTTDYTLMPTLANIHANLQSTTTNCAQCHAANVVDGFKTTHLTIVGSPTNHMPITTACETCHFVAGSSVTPGTPMAQGTKFSGSLMSHTGITTGCVNCHVPSGTTVSFAGISKIVGMPATTPVGVNSHIPSSTTCETCHLSATPAGLVAANASKTAPGTAFLTAAVPLGPQIHTGITGSCSSCHDTNMVWMGMSVAAYAINPSKITTGAQYKGFQTRPTGAPSTAFGVTDAAHPAGECSSSGCHTGTTYFSGDLKPTNHIPYASTALCTACHTTTDYTLMPTLANIHANLQSTTTNCAQCHAANVVDGFKTTHLTIVGSPTNHMPITTACETCHFVAGSSVTPGTPMAQGTKFSGSLMSHTGITTGCVNCHVPSGTTVSFAGISKIVGMPATTPVGVNSHIPSSTTCETCHLSATPAGLVAANASKTAPGTAFLTAAVPLGPQIHTGITGSCSSCHDTNMVWMGMSVAAYAINPSKITTGAQYKGFQTRPTGAPSTAFGVTDAAHPAGECSSSGCHTGTTYFSGDLKPTNHIPYASTALCTACHTTTDYTLMPTLANIHANLQSTTTNCAQCHAANVVDGFKTTHLTIVGSPTNHMPITTACETCHFVAGSSVTPGTPMAQGTKFSGSLMSHTGITTGCVNCHVPSGTTVSFAGISKIVGMPATTPVGVNSHIPSSTTCETCHLSATPAGLVAANASKTAPGTAFLTAAVPLGPQIHTGITGSCSSCHDTNMVWMGMSVAAYAINPSKITTGAQYKGFQTRPTGAPSTAFGVTDAAHPAGECSSSGCHTGTTYFSGDLKPTNHIPYASTALCTACHTTTDYTLMPTLANIHANLQSTTTNCAQCHAANVVDGFKTTHLTIVGSPTNHMPITTACETCHFVAGSSVTPGTPMAQGTKFSGSLMSHTGITTGCVNCHVPSGTTVSFAGISKIVGMPATTPVGVNSHIPSSTTCETCHLSATPAGLVAANASKTAPGTAFLTAAVPLGPQIHTGITGSCSSCHDTNMVWMGMSVAAYAINPSTITTGAQYKGFQTRPTGAPSTAFGVTDAAHPAGECSSSGCHTGTTYFSGNVKPAGHMPTTGTCSTCHIVAGDYSVAGLASNIVLHAGISSGCITCHTAGTGKGPFAGCTTQASCASPPPLTYQPKMMPLVAGGSATAPSSLTHVPAVGIACEGCHSPTVFTNFTGMNMKNNATAHTALGTATCMSCHEYPYVWYGVTIKTTGSASHHGRKAGQDCISCHTKSYNQWSGAAARVRPMMRGAAGAISQRFLPGGGLTAGLLATDTSVFSHAGVASGQCQTCHNGQVASGLPPVHPQTHMSCDNCHRTTAWLPAQFTHQGVLQGQCLSCHNNVAASGRPAGHFVTMRSCDSCHRTVAWLPVSYTHVSPLYQAQPGNPGCVVCHVTNGEIIPRQMRGNNRPRPVPVHTGP